MLDVEEGREIEDDKKEEINQKQKKKKRDKTEKVKKSKNGFNRHLLEREVDGDQRAVEGEQN